MKIQVAAIGVLKQGPEKTLIDQYATRITWPLTITELVCKKNLQDGQLKKAEADLILGVLPPQTPLIALDERGKNLSSPQFANLIDSYQLNGSKTLTFCIGGAFGLDESIRKQAEHTLSFGELTWPHMLVRVMLLEQLYRAQQILSNHPYHKV